MNRFPLGRSASIGERVHLPPAVTKHARRVLRLEIGDAIELFDGEGGNYRAEIVSLAGGAVEARILAALDSEREPALALTLAVAVAKGAKLDWVIEKVTELGVGEIRPFLSARTIPRDRDARRVERWRRIAEAATAQSGRSVVPAVLDLTPFEGVLGASADLRILFHPHGGAPLGAIHEKTPTAKRILLATGPEGGFAAEEVDGARAAGFDIGGLGPRVLRAETAAVAAVTLAAFEWGDLGGDEY